MMQVALAAPDRPITVAEVAEREGLSADYAGKLLYWLRRAGLVNSVQGRKGGFVLARPAYTISVADMLQVFSSHLFDDDFCQCYTGSQEECVRVNSCSLRPVWWGISQLITRTLERITLTDLIRTEEEMLDRMRRVIEGAQTPEPGGTSDSL